MLIVQIGLGGATVTEKLSAPIVTAHLGTAMLLLATVTLTATAALGRGREFASRGGIARGQATAFRTAAFVAAGGMYLLLLSGAYTASSGAGTSCSGWPLCNGQVIPAGTRFVQIHFAHRLVVALVTIAFTLLVYGAPRWLRGNRTAQRLVRDAFGLSLAQIVVGALNVWTKLATPVRVLHLAVAAALWTALAVVAWLAFILARQQGPLIDGAAERLPTHAARPGRAQEAAR